MRLDSLELKAIKSAIKQVKGHVYLFGSRVDDAKKGGDIDLLILTSENPLKTSREVTVRFNLECDEKIDVVVMDPDLLNQEQQAFLNTLSLVPIQ